MELYHKQQKYSSYVPDNGEIPEGFTDKRPQFIPGETWSEDAGGWIVDEGNLLSLCKVMAVGELSAMCKSRRAEILDDTKILNILTGAIAGYPAYLTAANVSRMIEMYKQLYHDTAELIEAATTAGEVRRVLDSVVFPTEAEILQSLEA